MLVGFNDVHVSIKLTNLWRARLTVECDPLPGCSVNARRAKQSCAAMLCMSAWTSNENTFGQWAARDADLTSGEHPFQFGTREREFVDSRGTTCIINSYALDDSRAARLHRTLESTATWFIENASRIDASDHRWTMMVLYCIDKEAGECACAGYCTVFSFCNPVAGTTRRRICQMLVLPHYQRLGYGKALLECVYASARAASDVIEITVEDPCPGFIRMRDSADYSALHSAFPITSENDDDEARIADHGASILKLTRRQIVRCVEMRRLARLDAGSDEAVKAYRLGVKRRLFQGELAEALGGIEDKDERKKLLATKYDALARHYKRIVARHAKKNNIAAHF